MPNAVNNEALQRMGASFGIGLPISMRSTTRVNLGIDYSERGKNQIGWIQEQTLRFSLGVSFTEQWLDARKYD
jgi:hypothetical protein